MASWMLQSSVFPAYAYQKDKSHYFNRDWVREKVTAESHQNIQCLWGNSNIFQEYCKIMSPGVKIKCQGETETKEWVTEANIQEREKRVMGSVSETYLIMHSHTRCYTFTLSLSLKKKSIWRRGRRTELVQWWVALSSRVQMARIRYSLHYSLRSCIEELSLRVTPASYMICMTLLSRTNFRKACVE